MFAFCSPGGKILNSPAASLELMRVKPEAKIQTVAIYTRVTWSNDEKSAKAARAAARAQARQLKEYCADQRWGSISPYQDRTVAPKVKTFRAYNWMMGFAEERGFDLILFWSLDQLFSGGAREILNWVTKLDSLGIGWRSHTDDGFDSRDNKAGILAALRAVAKQESTRFSNNAKKGIAASHKTVGRPRISLQDIKAALGDGGSVAAIAERSGLSPQTIYRYKQQLASQKTTV